jgi:TolB protein
LRTVAAAVLLAPLLAGCGGSHHPAPDPCGLERPGAAWLAFGSTRSGNYDVYVVRADGTCLAPVTTDAAADLFPAWLPDGDLGFSSARRDPGVYVHRFASGGEVNVLDGTLPAAAPAWSPDGATVAFEGTPASDGLTRVYTVPASGGVPYPLTAPPGESAGPAWAPDGSRIYFVSSRAGGYRIYAMGPSGQAPVAIPGTAGVLGRPAVSPDGKTLAYARLDATGTAEVVLHDLASDAEVVVSDQGDSEPAFDPAGARLALTSTRGGAPAVWIVDAAEGGAHAVQVTHPGAVDGQPAFRPR